MGLPRLMPAADRLAVDLELTGHLGLAEALVKEFGGLEPPLFEMIMLVAVTDDPVGA